MYAKLLVQKARKKIANEVRARSEENEAFGKSQAEKYLGETHKKAEAIAAGKAEMKLAIEGLRVHNLELAKELKINLSQLQVSALRVPSECTRIGRTWPLAKKALTSALSLYLAARSAGVSPFCGAGTRRTRAVGSEGRQRPKGRRAGAAHDDGAASEGACPPPSRHQ